MPEIYIRQTSPIRFKLYWSGEIRDADGSVTATVRQINSDGTTGSTIATYTATKLETDIGTYQVTIPYILTDTNKNLVVTWSYLVDTVAGFENQFVSVITPYVNISDVIEDLNIGTDQSDPNYKSYHELQLAEKYSRKVIEAYTNQVFYNYTGTQIVYGHGSDILPLPTRIESVSDLHEEDLSLYSNGQTTDNWIYSPVVSESNYSIRVRRTDLQDNTIYTANGLIPPTINDRGYSGVFKKDFRYTVKGTLGWRYVPDNVQEACKILMQQYFEKDRAWKDKYVKNISTFDWKFEFSDRSVNGTGSLYADQLLAPYVTNGMVIF